MRKKNIYNFLVSRKPHDPAEPELTACLGKGLEAVVSGEGVNWKQKSSSDEMGQ